MTITQKETKKPAKANRRFACYRCWGDTDTYDGSKPEQCKFCGSKNLVESAA